MTEHDPSAQDAVGEELILREAGPPSRPDALKQIVTIVQDEAPDAVRRSASFWAGKTRQEVGKGQQEEAKARLIIAEVQAKLEETQRARERFEIEKAERLREQARADAKVLQEGRQVEAQVLSAQAALINAVAALRAQGATIDVSLFIPDSDMPRFRGVTIQRDGPDQPPPNLSSPKQ